MAPIIVNPDHVHEFVDGEAFYTWLSEHHASETEAWIKIHKVASGLPSINAKQAIDVVLCWGWIDGVRKGFDDKSFLQRYTPRTPKGVWSQINVDNVARLVAEGRMTRFGLAEVEKAKADGRWDRAYGMDMAIPDDLKAAIDASPAASQMLQRLTSQNRFALSFRLHAIKTDAARARNIEKFVAMLERGETIYPQKAR